MTQPSRTTIRDVAAHSGVSVTTVSHVLNEVAGKRISPDTRRRVWSAAELLHYQPNPVARSLRTRRSHTLGLVLENGPVQTPIAEVLLGAQEAALEAGFLLLLHPGLGAGRGVDMLSDRQVDGILFAGPPTGAGSGATSAHAPDGMPIVVVGGPADGPFSSVSADETAGARRAVQLLLDAGHHRIGLLLDGPGARSAHLRTGYAEALADRGLTLEAALVTGADAYPDGAPSAASALIDQSPRPTAVCCASDHAALDLYRAAALRGLDIPGDLSVIGFSDEPCLADTLQPRLTSMVLPYVEMGRHAVRLLLAQVAAAQPMPPDRLVLPVTLVDRGSVQPLP